MSLQKHDFELSIPLFLSADVEIFFGFSDRSSMPLGGGNAFDFTQPTPDLISRLAASFARKDEEDKEEVMDGVPKISGRAPSSHLSEGDLSLAPDGEGAQAGDSALLKQVRSLPSFSL